MAAQLEVVIDMARCGERRLCLVVRLVHVQLHCHVTYVSLSLMGVHANSTFCNNVHSVCEPALFLEFFVYSGLSVSFNITWV